LFFLKNGYDFFKNRVRNSIVVAEKKVALLRRWVFFNNNISRSNNIHVKHESVLLSKQRAPNN